MRLFREYPNLCGDISAGVFDLQGRMLAQAVTGTPGHINTMAEAVQTMLGYFPLDKMKPGDIYMTNDPWIGSGHLNDFLLVQPAFHHRSLVGFADTMARIAAEHVEGWASRPADAPFDLVLTDVILHGIPTTPMPP